MTRAELQIALKRIKRLALALLACVLLLGIGPVVISAHLSAGHPYRNELEWFGICWMIFVPTILLYTGLYILHRHRVACPKCNANLNNKITKQTATCWKCGLLFK